MRTLLALSAAAASLAMAVPAAAQDAQSAEAEHHAMHMALKEALAKENRAEDRARDVYRNPERTLAFFGVQPDMKIGEYAPGGGWYTRVLGNYVNDQGRLVGLYFNPTTGPFNEQAQQGIRDGAAGFPAQAAEWTGAPESRFAGMTLDTIPDAEKGTFDRILVIRMMHNLMRWNTADSEIAAMRELLSDDGMIGIVQHRAKADADWSYANGSKGYVRQQDVIDFMRVQGFELVGMSDVNANPRDTADHPQGVWEMPPVLRGDRADLADLGESDRMTLLFRKAD
ncbi:methyltransferase [Qipengyuania sp. JC766]|uniref:class I SAM-dependent methyltransferase n=1 Tax=Qipengyuania sp. JC766 TaxID=3232139 RepID=UPI00345797A6